MRRTSLFFLYCGIAVLLVGGLLMRSRRHLPNETASDSPSVNTTLVTTRDTALPHPISSVETHTGQHAPLTDTGSTNPAPAVAAQTVGPDEIPGEYIFRFYNERDRLAFEAVARRLGIRVVGSLSVGHAVRIRVLDPDLLQQLRREGPTPTDWMPNTYVRIPEQDGNAPLAPESGYTAFGGKALSWLGVTDNATWGNGITVAVLDTGIATTASLGAGAITHLDLVGEAGHAAVHGTAVASLISGRDKTAPGVAPAATLLSIKVMSDAGVGDAFTLAKGIIEAVDRGARIINFSGGSKGDSSILREAVQYAVDRGVLFVAPVGNDAVLGVQYPARYDIVIAVGAVGPNGDHLYFSNRGPEVALTAPGAGVAAASPDGDTVLFSGTSAAAPLVAGTIAALLSESPELTLDDIMSLLAIYSNDAGAPGADDMYGAGILDVERLTTRDADGVYDMVAMSPHVRNDAATGKLHVDISAQNRGTEPIDEVKLVVEWNQTSQTFTFFNVGVGDTISQPFTFAHDTLTDGLLDVLFVVRPVGVNDAVPGNNGIHSVVSVLE